MLNISSRIRGNFKQLNCQDDEIFMHKFEVIKSVFKTQFYKNSKSFQTDLFDIFSNKKYFNL